jgi:hypothetical protein
VSSDGAKPSDTIQVEAGSHPWRGNGEEGLRGNSLGNIAGPRVLRVVGKVSCIL